MLIKIDWSIITVFDYLVPNPPHKLDNNEILRAGTACGERLI